MKPGSVSNGSYSFFKSLIGNFVFHIAAVSNLQGGKGRWPWIGSDPVLFGYDMEEDLFRIPVTRHTTDEWLHHRCWSANGAAIDFRQHFRPSDRRDAPVVRFACELMRAVARVIT